MVDGADVVLPEFYVKRAGTADLVRHPIIARPVLAAICGHIRQKFRAFSAGKEDTPFIHDNSNLGAIPNLVPDGNRVVRQSLEPFPA